MTAQYTIEWLAEKVLTAYKYADDVELVYDSRAKDFVVRWGHDPDPDDPEEEWGATIRDSTLRGVLEEAYHGMYLS